MTSGPEPLGAGGRDDYRARNFTSNRSIRAPGLEPQDVSRGATIFAEGEAGTVAYILLRGDVTIFIGFGTPISAPSTELKPGQMFGVHALMAGAQRAASAGDDAGVRSACGKRGQAQAKTGRSRSVPSLLGRLSFEAGHRPVHAIAFATAPMTASPTSQAAPHAIRHGAVAVSDRWPCWWGRAVTVTNYFETRRTAIKVAADTFKTTIGRINEQRLAFFTPAFLLTAILRNAPSFQTADGSKEQSGH